MTAQPAESSGGAQSTAEEGVPPPARPVPARKRSFFAGPGLGLLLAGAGTGAAVAVSNSDDENTPTSP